MNLTLAIPDRLLAEARRLADARGVSLNQLIREELERVTGAPGEATQVESLRAMWVDGEGNSAGKPWNREDLHDRPIVRRHQRSDLR